jgi:hypothetical protein
MIFTKLLWIRTILIYSFGAMFSLAARLVLVHSEYYPAWLRTGTLAASRARIVESPAEFHLWRKTGN